MFQYREELVHCCRNTVFSLEKKNVKLNGKGRCTPFSLHGLSAQDPSFLVPPDATLLGSHPSWFLQLEVHLASLIPLPLIYVPLLLLYMEGEMGKWLLLLLLLFVFPRLVAQTVKNLPAMQETQVRSLGWEDPLENGMATHSSIPAWRIPWADQGVAKSRTRQRDYCFLFTFFLSQEESWVSGFWRSGSPPLFRHQKPPKELCWIFWSCWHLWRGLVLKSILCVSNLESPGRGCFPGIRAVTESWTPSIGLAGVCVGGRGLALLFPQPSLLCIFNESLACVSSRPGLGRWAWKWTPELALGEKSRPGLGPDWSPASLPMLHREKNSCTE